MKDISTTKIEQDSSFIRIIAHEEVVSNDLFNWHDPEQYGGWLTLKEISDRLTQLGYQGVFYVWVDTPLSGTIYQFGNFLPRGWIEYGSTIGFA